PRCGIKGRSRQFPSPRRFGMPPRDCSLARYTLFRLVSHHFIRGTMTGQRRRDRGGGVNALWHFAPSTRVGARNIHTSDPAREDGRQGGSTMTGRAVVALAAVALAAGIFVSEARAQCDTTSTTSTTTTSTTSTTTPTTSTTTTTSSTTTTTTTTSTTTTTIP